MACEGVEEAGGEHAEHVGEQLDHDGGERPGRGIGGPVEQDVGEVGREEDEADQVRPDVDRLVVQPEPAKGGGSK